VQYTPINTRLLASAMLVSGRGSIANVQYTGDEAAAEIRKLLEAVVGSFARACTPRTCADEL